MHTRKVWERREKWKKAQTNAKLTISYTYILLNPQLPQHYAT